MSKYYNLRFPGFLERALTLSYDDGANYDRHLVEILNEHKIKCTFNLNSEHFAKVPGSYHLTKEEALEIYQNSPHEVAIHGARHLNPTNLRPDELLREITVDRNNLETMFERVIKGMAYAYGSYNDEVVNILQLCGIDYCRTTVSTEKFEIPTDWLRLPATCHHTNPRFMEITEEFLGENKAGNDTYGPRLFYLWGHSYEFNDHNNWSLMEEFAQKVGNRDDIWYATNGEVFAYVKAFEGLRFSFDRTMIENPSSLDVYLCIQKKNILCKAGSLTKVQ